MGLLSQDVGITTGVHQTACADVRAASLGQSVSFVERRAIDG
jgi:hypothetical protein